MRGAFSLIGLLVVAFIVMYLWATHTSEVAKQAKPAMEQAHQMAGEDADGMKAKDSIKLDPMEHNGKLKSMIVDKIVEGGPMQKYFGLQRDDQIIAVGPLDMSDYDAEMARSLILEAYQRKQELSVMRDGERITLPQPGANTNPRPKRTTGLDQQLDAVRSAQPIPTH